MKHLVAVMYNKVVDFVSQDPSHFKPCYLSQLNAVNRQKTNVLDLPFDVSFYILHRASKKRF